MMARIGTVLSVEHGDEGPEIVVDMGGGETITADHFEPSNFDSLPSIGDSAAVEISSGSGRYQATGYAAPDDSSAKHGETIIRGRTAIGAIVSTLKVLDSGRIEISSNADTVINGATFASIGTVSIDGSTTIGSGTDSAAKATNTSLSLDALKAAIQSLAGALDALAPGISATVTANLIPYNSDVSSSNLDID